MSKTFDSLKRTQDQRENGNGISAKDKPIISEAIEKKPTKGPASSVHRAPWLGKAILTFSILTLLIFNLTFLMTIKGLKSERKEIISKLSQKVELSASKNSKQINAISEGMKQVSSESEKLSQKMEETNINLKKLAQKNEVQAFAIENLLKAKNILFNRASALEARISKAGDVSNQ